MTDAIADGPALPENGKEVMVTLDTLRRERKAEILRLAELHGCRNVSVFGSVATGENRPDSDVDFLVDLDSGRGLAEWLSTYGFHPRGFSPVESHRAPALSQVR